MTDKIRKPKTPARPDPTCVVCSKNSVPRWVMPADGTPICDACQRGAAAEGGAREVGEALVVRAERQAVEA